MGCLTMTNLRLLFAEYDDVTRNVSIGYASVLTSQVRQQNSKLGGISRTLNIRTEASGQPRYVHTRHSASSPPTLPRTVHHRSPRYQYQPHVLD